MNHRTDDRTLILASVCLFNGEHFPNFALLFSAETEEVTWENRAAQSLFPPQLTLCLLKP